MLSVQILLAHCCIRICIVEVTFTILLYQYYQINASSSIGAVWLVKHYDFLYVKPSFTEKHAQKSIAPKRLCREVLPGVLSRGTNQSHGRAGMVLCGTIRTLDSVLFPNFSWYVSWQLQFMEAPSSDAVKKSLQKTVGVSQTFVVCIYGFIWIPVKSRCAYIGRVTPGRHTISWPVYRHWHYLETVKVTDLFTHYKKRCSGVSVSKCPKISSSNLWIYWEVFDLTN